MTATRIEEDLLGPREIPADAYWGVHTLRATENFQISATTINDVPEMIRGIVMVKKAAALANKELLVLPADIADAIVAACDLILEEGRCMDQFPVDVYQGGAGTSTNMNANEVIANLALEVAGFEKGRYDLINPNDHVNKSQSTNDAYPSGFRVGILIALEELYTAIQLLSESFAAKGEEFAHVLKMGRTQLQDAVPMSLGQEFRSYASNIAEELRRIDNAEHLLAEVNLGATAVGTGLNAPPGYAELAASTLAEVSGFAISSAQDLVEATYDNGAYVATHSALKRLATKLSKICNDLRLLSSGPRAGLKEINLPELQAGSSIMPAKVNPVIPEVVSQVCFNVIGNDMTVTMASEAGQLELNVMEPALAQAMFDSIKLLVNACDALRTKCVDGITANEERCRDYVMNSIGIVTYLVPFIGHHNGDRVGRACAVSGRSVREVVLEMGLMTEEEVDRVLSAENFLNPTYSGRRYEEGERVLPEPGADAEPETDGAPEDAPAGEPVDAPEEAPVEGPEDGPGEERA
ncbi:MAG: aspartate ammonia-lyase [bacterium]|nr:aspartate ammonia-lyase [bacterium]